MPFDVIAFGEAAPGTGTPNLAACAGEDLYHTSGDKLYLTSKVNSLLGVYAFAESTGGYVAVRQVKNMIDHRFIKIHGVAANLHATMHGFTDFRGRPLPLYPEILQALINNATDEDALIGLFIGNGAIPRSSLDRVRPTHSIRGIADQAATAFTWTDAAITWDKDLPLGSYVPVGMKCAVYKSSAAMPALARLKVPANMNWRPGVVCVEAQADKLEVQDSGIHPFADWPLMNELRFPYDHPPNIEVLGAEASTDWLIELQLQKVGQLPTSEVSSTKTAWVKVVRNDFRRVVLRIVNTDGTNAVKLSRDSDTPPGFTLGAGEEFKADDARRDFYSYAPTAAVTLSVMEEYTELGSVSRGARRGEGQSTPPPDDDGGGGGTGEALRL